MFPLLSGRSRTLASPNLGMGTTYTSNHVGNAVLLTLTLTPTGTWAFTVGPGDSLSGSPSSGSWGDSGSGGITRVRYTPTGFAPSTNNASSFVYLTANRVITVDDLGVDQSTSVLIELIEDGGDSVSQTITMNLNGV